MKWISCLSIFLICGLRVVNSQVSFPYFDSFSYSDGNLTNAVNWSAHSGVNSFIQVSSGEVILAHGSGSREDVNVGFSSVSTGSVFASFDFRVNDNVAITGTNSDYFAHFNSSLNHTAKIFVTERVGSGDFRVGISTDGSTEDSTWSSDLSFSTNYTLVMSYNFNSEISQLWLDPSSMADPSISGNVAMVTSISAFSFRQGNSSADETITIDNLRLGSSFAEVIPEPSTYALIFGGVALGGVLVWKRRLRAKQVSQ